MIRFASDVSTVLAIGAHPDDIELGAGGILLKMQDAGWKVVMLVATDGARGGEPLQRNEEQDRAARFLNADLLWGGLEDGDVQVCPATINKIESVVREYRPQVVLTHWREDTHQDHRNLSLATISACRRVDILICYEVPSTERFEPAIFEHLNDEELRRKNELVKCHQSQLGMGDRRDVLEWMNHTGKYRGQKVRRRFCEAFHPIHASFLSRLIDPMQNSIDDGQEIRDARPVEPRASAVGGKQRVEYIDLSR